MVSKDHFHNKHLCHTEVFLFQDGSVIIAPTGEHSANGPETVTKLVCDNGDLLTDTDPRNHNDSEIIRERTSVAISPADTKCIDSVLTPRDFDLTN